MILRITPSGGSFSEVLTVTDEAHTYHSHSVASPSMLKSSATSAKEVSGYSKPFKSYDLFHRYCDQKQSDYRSQPIKCYPETRTDRKKEASQDAKI